MLIHANLRAGARTGSLENDNEKRV